MSVSVLLIRHGSHDRLGRVLCGRMAGVMLNEAGQLEAGHLADALAGRALAAVYASPLDRAMQTAAPIAARQAQGVAEDRDLLELDFGSWTGRRFDSLADDPDWRQWNHVRLHARPPAGETMLEAQLRAVRFLLRMRDRHDGSTVVAVSHGDMIRSALAWALGLPLDSYARFEIGPASVSQVELGDWGAKVWSINAGPAAWN